MNEKVERRDYEIDLLELLKVLLEHIGIIIAVTVFAGLVALCFAEFYMPVKYESYATMYVKNANDATSPQEDAAKVAYADLTASKSLAGTYVVALKSKWVINETISALTQKYERSGKLEERAKYLDPDRINKMYSLSTVDDTEVLKITARTTDPEVAADVCNTIAEIAPEFLIRVVGAGSVEVIDKAVIELEPVEPNVKRVTVLGAMMGFMAVAGVLIILYLADNSVKSTDQLSKKFEKAIIGEVFNFSQEKGEKKKKQKKGEHRDISPDNLINDNTVFTLSESYKTMRTNAVFALSPFDNKVFAVTSANASEGKSTTTANLAIAFAQTENNVLLIDADMRKPTQHKLFEKNNKAGLSTAISKMNKLDDCICHNVRKGLDLMPAGPIPPNPSELLASQNFQKIIEELSGKYDYIIIDSPPVNVVSDVLVMHNSIVGTMFVTKYADTTYDAIEAALKKIELAEIKMLGFILNDISKPHAGKYYSYKKYGYKYGYGYGYGYSYGEKPQTETESKSGKKKA